MIPALIAIWLICIIVSGNGNDKQLPEDEDEA